MLKTLRLCIDLGHRQVEKFARGFEKMHRFFIQFSPKIDDKSSPKVRKTLFARKIDKTSLPGAPFGAKDRFLVDFGVPEGTQIFLKIYEGFWVKGSWEPSGSHFGRFSALFLILALLFVNSGSILGHPGSIF